MAGLFKRLVRLLRKPPTQPRKPLNQAEKQRIAAAQAALSERLGQIPGVRVPGGWTPWYSMNSTNVDRIRYLESARLCQVVYKKKGDLYQYEGVEPEIFLGWLQSHSPGQYQWYVIRAYGYRHTKLASGQDVSPPRENRFEGEPFAVPESIEAFQRSRGRASVDIVPTAVGFAPPPTDAWKQFRRP